MSQSKGLNMLSGKLARFAGANTQNDGIGEIGVRVDEINVEQMREEQNGHKDLAYSVWSVCFHLYSGATEFCFRLLDAAGATRTQIAICADIGPLLKLGDLKNRIAILGGPCGFEEQNRRDMCVRVSNTAIQFVFSKPMATPLDSQLPQQVDVLLRAGLLTASPKGQIAKNICWNLIYRRSFISDEEARRLAATVEHVAHTLLSNPACTIAELGVSPQDWDAISKWNKLGQRLERQDQLVHGVFTAAVRVHSQEQAVAAWDGQMSYRELDEASSALAKQVAALEGGFSNRRSKWVALCFDKSRWAIVAMLAVLKAGYACVFLDPSYPDQRLRQILEATTARVVLTSARDETLVMRFSNLDLGEQGAITVHQVPSSVDAVNKLRLRRDSGVDVMSVPVPQDPAFAIFTSGSTGTPKGIVLTHASVCTSISRIAESFSVDVSSRILQFASFAFDASLSDILTGLLNGATICIPSDDERNDDLQAYMHREQINLAWLTPTVARMLDPALTSTHLRQLVLIGEAIARSDISHWMRAGVVVYNGYGPAEATFVATLTKCQEGVSPRNIGQGLNYRTWVVSIPESTDESDKNMMNKRYVLPIGAKGELFLEGPSLADGYLNDTLKTESSFVANPAWLPRLSSTGDFTRRVYSTKDMVRYCPDGSLEYLDRVSNDTQVKLGGQRVELAEVETQLAQMPSVPEFIVVLPKHGVLSGRLVVVFISDEKFGEDEDVAFRLIPSQSRDVDLSSRFAAYLKDRLPHYMVPSIWVAVDKLPVTASGKRDRTAVLQKMESLSKREVSNLCRGATLSEDAQETREEVPSQQTQDPESENTTLLRLSCSQVLQVDLERIPAVGCSFIRLGGDSIAAMRVSTSLRRTASLKVSVRDLMTSLSLHEVAFKMEPVSGLQHTEGAKPHINSSKSSSQDILATVIPRIHAADNVADVYPSTPMQTSLLLSQSNMSKGTEYQLSMAWRVSCPTSASGLVDPDRLEAAWHQVVERHSALRTVIVEEASAFHQVVLRKYRSPCARLWFNNDEELEQTVRSPHPANEAAVLPTQTKCARPAYSVAICSTQNSQKVYLRLDINHVLLDGLSALNILRDIAAAYRCQDDGRISCILSPAPVDSVMGDFVAYIADTKKRAESIEYWKEYLVGVEACIFPTLVDSRRIEGDEGQTRRVGPVSLPVTLRDIHPEELGIILSENDATLASLFLLVWSIVLRMYVGGGDNDPIFGYLASGRDAPVDGIDDAVGCFISMLVCRGGWGRRQEEELSLLEALRQIHQSSVDSALHQAVSLADIHNAVPNLEGGRLFNTTVTLMPLFDEDAQEGSPLAYEQVLNMDPTEFDLSLAVESSRTSLQVSLIYHLSFMSSNHAHRIADTVCHVLRTFLHNPHQTLSSVCGRPSTRDLDTIWQWNKHCVTPEEACVHDLLESSMISNADREAIYSWDGTLTYRELDRLSSALARHLRHVHHVGPEVVVPLLFEKSSCSVVSQVAVLRCGGCFLMLEPTWPDDRMHGILQEVDAHVMLHSIKFKSQVSRWLLDKRQNERAGHWKPSLITRGVVEAMSVIEDTTEALDSGVRPGNAAYVIYTSGSTGRPKGITMTHRSVCTRMREHVRLLQYRSSSRVLALTAISFDMAHENVVLTLQAGGCLCLPSEEDRLSVSGVTSFAGKSRANWLSCTPSFLSLFTEGPPCMPNIKVAVVAGEPVPQRLVELWAADCMLVNAFGPSEVALGYCVAAHMIADKTLGNEIGRGFRATTWIVNEHNDSELRPIGAVGELLLEGPCLARGYLRQPDLTARIFLDERPRWSCHQLRQFGRLYKTGDLVRYTSDGTLVFLGRKDEQIKINGIRTELGDIESRLTSALEPRLRAVCRMAVDLLKCHERSSNSTDMLVAFIYISGGAEDVEEEDGEGTIIGNPTNVSFQAVVDRILRHEGLRSEALATYLPRHMIPKAFVPLRLLPMTSSGKFDRRALRRAVRDMHHNQILSFQNIGRLNPVGLHEQQPASPSERQLADIWKHVLRVDQVSLSDNFFRLGGDSLGAIKLKAQVHRVLDKELSIADIFAHPILTDMAAVLEQLAREASNELGFDGGSEPSIDPLALLSVSKDGTHPNNDFLSDVTRECDSNVAPDDIEDVLPCTPIQEALMAVSAHSSTNRTSTYSIQIPYRLSHEVDIDAFHAAWSLVVQRTPVLRSRIIFLLGYGSLLVICRSSATPTIEKLRHSSSFARDLESFRASHNFGYGMPLFRVRILEGPGRTSIVREAQKDKNDHGFHYLILSAHHAVYDGWSLRLLWRDVLKAYDAAKSGALSLFDPTGSPSFQSLVRHLQRQPKDASEKFWEGLLSQYSHLGEDSDDAGNGPELEFPQIPTQHSPLACCRRSFVLESLNATLAHQAQSEGITFAAMLRAAWAIVLAQYSACRIVSFGCTLSGRDVRINGIEHLRGPTMTVVPLQVAVRPEQSVLDFVRHIQDTVTAMVPHEHLGLQNIQQLSAAASRACSFTSLLTVQPPDDDVNDDDEEWPTLDRPSRRLGIELVGPVEVSGFHPLPLAIEIFHNRAHTKMVAEVSFDPVCIDETLLENVFLHFNHILQILWCQIGSSQSSSLADAIQTPSRDHLARVEAWNFFDANTERGLDSSAPQNNLLHEMFENQAVQQPDAAAIVSHDGSYTYSELNKAATLLAVQVLELRGRCMDPKSRVPQPLINPVGLCFEHSASALVAMLAVLKTGAPFLPLSPSNPPARLVEMVQDAGCTLILVSPSHLNMFSDEHAKDTPGTGRPNGSLLAVDQTMLDNLSREPRTSLSKFNFLADTPSKVPSTSLAYILFTSGSTGRPKGVKMQHSACAAAIMALSHRFGLDKHTRRLQFTDYSFDNSIEDVFGTLSVGGCVCVPSDSERVNDLAAFCQTNAVNSIHVTPSVLRLLLGNWELKGISSCVVGGEPLTRRDVEMIDQWIQSSRGQLRVHYAYGSTETCIDCTAAEIVPTGEKDKARRDRERNIGRSINPGLWRTWIVSTIFGTLAPLGAVGELCIEGSALAQGYIETPSMTRRANFLTNPHWHPAPATDTRVYRTGDLVRYESDGTILYLGRRDGQVKINGKRVELGEVEDHIMAIARQDERLGVREVAVGLCDSQHPHAALLMTEGGAWDDDDVVLGICFSTSRVTSDIASNLYQDLKRALPSHMVPQSFIAIDKIPATASGKRDRRRINEFLQTMCRRATAPGLAGEGENHQVHEWELHGHAALLQQWWSEVLPNIGSAKGIAPDAHFFALGANSITSIKLAGLARRFGYVLRYENIFSFPILSDMAKHMESASTMRSSELPDNQSEKYVVFELLDAAECEMVLTSAANEYGIPRDSIQDAYPCTPLQEALLAATARDPGSYIMAEQVKVSCESLPRVKEAFEYALGMFETFRACVVPAPGPASAGHAHVQLVLRHAPAWREGRIVEMLVNRARTDFGYGQPLVSLCLVVPDNASDGTATIVIVAHHAAYDGPSFDLFWTAVNEHLSQPRDSYINKLPGIELFSSFIKQIASHFEADAARKWWKTDLDGFVDSQCSLIHQTDSLHHPLATLIRHRSVQIPSKMASAAVKTTLATTARAAWSLTLSHFTASADTVYGAGISVLGAIVGDGLLAQQVAGPTIATVPSRALIDYDETVATFLERIQCHAAAETQFAYLGLRAIASESASCRKACDFDSIFVVQQNAKSDVSDGKLSGSHRLGSNQAELVGAEAFYPHPVVVTCYPREGYLDVELIHDPIIIPGKYAEAILDVFDTLLRNLVDEAQANVQLRNIAALSETGLASVLRMVRPDILLPRNQHFLHDAIRERAACWPFSEAISAWDGSLTYQCLDQEASRLAVRVRRVVDGMRPIAFLLDRGKWPIITMLAIMKAGCAFVPLDKRYPLQRMQRMIDLADVQLVVTQKAYNKAIGGLGCHSLLVEDLLEEYANDKYDAYVGADTNQISTGDPDTTVAYILFTSGSTGMPKGVVMPHSSLCTSLLGLAKAAEAPLTQRSRVLQFSSYTFDASMWEVFSTLLVGGTVCVPSEQDRLDRLEDSICRFAVDEAMLTPSVARVIDPSVVAGCLRTLRLCGEAISSTDRARWTADGLGIRIVGAYGTTESGIVSHYHDLTPNKSNHKGLGRSAHCRSWVVNPLKHDELAPYGAIGELCVEGWVLARGYTGDQSRNAAGFMSAPSWMSSLPWRGDSPDVIYKTGDLVYYDRDGTLIYIGRKDADTQVKLRGQRIELGEVEAAIYNAVQNSVSSNGFDIPAAVEVFVPSHGTVSQQTLGVAFAIGKLQGRGDLDTLEIHRQLSEFLPAYMVPTHFVTLDQLPLKDGSGKLDRIALRTLMASSALPLHSSTSTAPSNTSDGTASTVDPVLEPLSDTEAMIRSILADLLRKSDANGIARTDDFFSLGGDSITAMRLVSMARRKGVEIHVADVFAHPTIAGMASCAQQTIVNATCAPQPLVIHDRNQGPLLDEVARFCGCPTDTIDAIYPCTPAQVFLRSHIVRFHFALRQDVDIGRLRQAIDSCVAAYPILRTRIVPAHNAPETHVQAVLKHTCHPPHWAVRDVAPGLDEMEPQDVPEDKSTGFAVEAAGSSNHLVWTLSHALYDGWSLNLLTQTIEQVYLDPATTLPPSLPYADFVHYQTQQRETAAKTHFWETYLSGMPTQPPLLFDYGRLLSQASPPEPPPQRDQTATYLLPMPKVTTGVTPATFLVAAWAKAIGAATQAQESTIAYVVSGRSANLAGIETCIGPTICRVPLRIRLSAGLAMTATNVQKELTHVMPYELSGLDGLHLAAEAGTNMLPLEIVVQPRSGVLTAERLAPCTSQSDAGRGGKLLALTKAEPVRPLSGGFMVVVTMLEDEEQLDTAVYWDQRAADRVRVDGLMEKVREILGE